MNPYSVAVIPIVFGGTHIQGSMILMNPYYTTEIPIVFGPGGPYFGAFLGVLLNANHVVHIGLKMDPFYRKTGVF